MPAATTAGGPGGNPPGQAGMGGAVPFIVGSNAYAENNFHFSVKQSDTAQDRYFNVTPGGFLRGIRIQVENIGGQGHAEYHDDTPWSIIQSISLENIDGSPIKYPMSGYACYLVDKYAASWSGDPAHGPGAYGFGDPGGNFGFELHIWPEIRDTAGVLANTDARAQYRLRITIAPAAHVYETAPSTMPETRVTGVTETWAQTDREDLHGNSIQFFKFIKSLKRGGADDGRSWFQRVTRTSVPGDRMDA